MRQGGGRGRWSVSKDEAGASATRRGRWFRARLASILLAMVGVPAVPACSSTPQVAPDREAALRRIDASDRRLASLDRFEATGTAVLPIRDASGEIEQEQLDLLILRERPGRLAVRLKLSVTDTLAWLGSDGARWWLFLPEEDPSTVWHGAVRSEPRRAVGADEIPMPASLRHPLLVDLLLGLEPAGTLEGLGWDGSSRRWILESAVPFGGGNSGWRVRRSYPPDAAAPSRVEVLDPEGRLVAGSRLADHVRVEVPGRAVGDWPLVPMRIELIGPDPADGVVRLALERPSGLGRRVRPAAFEWERLLGSMRPTRIVDVGADS